MTRPGFDGRERTRPGSVSGWLTASLIVAVLYWAGLTLLGIRSVPIVSLNPAPLRDLAALFHAPAIGFLLLSLVPFALSVLLARWFGVFEPGFRSDVVWIGFVLSEVTQLVTFVALGMLMH